MKNSQERANNEPKNVLPFFKLINEFKEIGIQDEDLWKLLLQVDLVFFGKNEYLFRRNDEADNFYIVIIG